MTTKYFLGVALLVMAIGAGQEAQKTQSAPAMIGPPSTAALFQEIQSPYFGFGAIWIRPDGVVIIEAEDHRTIGFQANLTGQALVEENSVVTIAQTRPEKSALHVFAPIALKDRRCTAAVYYIPGAMDMDYDDSSGLLSIRIDGAKERFEGEFSFAKARAVAAPRKANAPAGQGAGAAPSARAEPPKGQPDNGSRGTCEGDSWTCVAESPEGARCCKKCYDGKTCTCKASGSGCTCSDCSQTRYEDVIVPIEQPAPPP